MCFNSTNKPFNLVRCRRTVLTVLRKLALFLDIFFVDVGWRTENIRLQNVNNILLLGRLLFPQIWTKHTAAAIVDQCAVRLKQPLVLLREKIQLKWWRKSEIYRERQVLSSGRLGWNVESHLGRMDSSHIPLWKSPTRIMKHTFIHTFVSNSICYPRGGKFVRVCNGIWAKYAN